MFLYTILEGIYYIDCLLHDINQSINMAKCAKTDSHLGNHFPLFLPCIQEPFLLRSRKINVFEHEAKRNFEKHQGINLAWYQMCHQ